MTEPTTSPPPPSHRGATQAERERFRRAEELFHRLLDCDVAERAARLRAECGEDRELLEEVESLLVHEDGLRTPVSPSGSADRTDLVGRWLGGFRILAPIGEGGMGVVYEAEQETPRRRVALKVLRAGLPSALGRARFEREIRLLGALQHPGIALILEAGVARADGGVELPFFAMELVDGEPIDTYARQRSLDVAQKLGLIALVCDAAQHAHQRGVIHRDLKPANVLVVTTDDKDATGLPKVLDFGVARATSDDGEDAGRLRTRSGALVGTLAYMSPEQLDGQVPDVRSDVYALGVLLYELLCGRLPIDVGEGTLAEVYRRIRELVPERPSTLAPELRGDVEAIVGKALEKRKEDRYQSAAELAADIRRHLCGIPIQARAHSALYLLERTIRRHRTVFGLGVAAVVSLIAFALYAGRQAERQEQLAYAAQEARDERGRAADELRIELHRSSIERGVQLARLGSLRAAEGLLWDTFLEDPGSPEALWGLRSFYFLYPCLQAAEVGADRAWSLVPHPDGERLLSSWVDGTLAVQDLDTLETRVLLEGHRFGATGVAVSREAGLVASLGGYLALLDLETLAVVDRFDGPEFQGCGLAFDASGTRLLLGGLDGVVRTLDLASRELTAQRRLHESVVMDLQVSPDGTLASASWDGSLAWVAPDGSEQRVPAAHPVGGGVRRIAFSADARELYSSGFDRRICAWDTRTGSLLRAWRSPSGVADQIGLHPSTGELIATGWWSLDAWRADPPRRRTPLPLGTDAFAWLRARGEFVTAHGRTLRRWSASALDAPRPWLRGAEGPTGAWFSREGGWLIVCPPERNAEVRDARDGSLLFELETPGTTIGVLADAERGYVWTVGTEARLHWPNQGNTPVLELEQIASGSARCVDVDQGRGLLLFARLDEPTLEVRELETGILVESTPAAGMVQSVAFVPGSDRLVYTTPNALHVVDPAGNELLRQAIPGVHGVRVSPDGASAICATFEGELARIDLDRLRPVTALVGHRAIVWDLSFRPGRDGELASASADGTVRVWDLESGRTLTMLSEPEGWEIGALSFDPRGDRLVYSTVRGELWSVDLGESLDCVQGNLAQRTKAALGTPLGTPLGTGTLEEIRVHLRDR